MHCYNVHTTQLRSCKISCYCSLKQEGKKGPIMLSFYQKKKKTLSNFQFKGIWDDFFILELILWLYPLNTKFLCNTQTPFLGALLQAIALPTPLHVMPISKFLGLVVLLLFNSHYKSSWRIWSSGPFILLFVG